MQDSCRRDQFCILEDAAAQALLFSEACDWAALGKVRRQKNPDEQITAYLEARNKKLTVSDAEVKRFYNDNKADLGAVTLSQAKDDIRGMLLNDKRRQANSAYIAALGSRYLTTVSRQWAEKQYAQAMDNSVENARKSGMPVLVDFSASYCSPCQMMVPFMEEIKKTYSGKLTCVSVDTEAEPALGIRYGASSIPLLIYYDKAGKEQFRHVGFYPKANVIAKLALIGVK